MIAAIVVFVLVYACMIALPSKYRCFVALGGAVVFTVMGYVPLNGIFGAIDWNILMMLFGTMGTVSFFIASNMPRKLASALLKITPDARWAIIAMALFAGIVSAFVDNVATLLMLAPVGLAIAKEVKVSPVAMLIAISVSSNLQGAATLVGDTTSIMLGGYAAMDFLDFFWMESRPGIFWAVELGALVTVPVMMILFREYKAPVSVQQSVVVKDYVPTVLLVVNLVALIAASFIPNKPDITNGLICTGIFAIAVVYYLIKGADKSIITGAFKEIDFSTLLLLASLFVIISGLTEAGVIDAISDLFVSVGGEHLFLLYTIIVWGSVLCSAFIDNIPYVATMLPVMEGIAVATGFSPYVLYFGLLSGATLGGNLTPIGASANITAIGILQREGYNVSFKEFARIGLPFTLSAVITGYLFIWFVWA